MAKPPTPALTCPVIRRQKRIIRTLVRRGADTTHALRDARRGLAGDFEDEAIEDPVEGKRPLDRDGYREIVELLRSLGIEE